MILPFITAPALMSPAAIRVPVSPDFHDSMVLEIPLKGLEAQKEGEFIEIDQFGGAVCDDTSISLFRAARKLKRGSDLVRVPLEFLIYVRPSFDRVVHLYLTLMDGDRPVATTTISTIKAAEKRVTWGRGTLEIKAADWSPLYTNGHVPTLKVFMKVVNNE